MTDVTSSRPEAEPCAYLRDIGGWSFDGVWDKCLVPAAKGDPGAFPVYRENPAPSQALREAAEYARSAIDRHLGDSDPANGSDDPLFIACQKLSAALDADKDGATKSDGAACGGSSQALREALERLRSVATQELRTTHLLASSPPQSAAAWDIRNAIDREIAALDAGKDGATKSDGDPSRDDLIRSIGHAENAISAHLEEFHDFDYEPHNVPHEVSSLRNIQHHLAGSLIDSGGNFVGPSFPTPAQSTAGETDVRWAVNVLLEKIAEKFEAWDTWDLWRSDAASTVRSFKHDLAALDADKDGAEKSATLQDLEDEAFRGGLSAEAYEALYGAKKSDGGVEGHAPKCEVEGVTVGSLVHRSARAEGKAETAHSNDGEKVRSHCFGEPRLGDGAALTAEGPQSAGIKPGPSDPTPAQSTAGDARQRIYDKLAQEGGGTWATYMMMEIEEAFAALSAPAQSTVGETVQRDAERFKHLSPDKPAVLPEGYSAPLDMRSSYERAYDAAWECSARKQSLPEPADCSWPTCGCDPYADKVIEALELSAPVGEPYAYLHDNGNEMIRAHLLAGLTPEARARYTQPLYLAHPPAPAVGAEEVARALATSVGLDLDQEKRMAARGHSPSQNYLNEIETYTNAILALLSTATGGEK